MRNGLLLLVGLLIVGVAAAQTPAEVAKYEVIRESINFLATDRIASRDTTFRISCESLDYDCFRNELSAEPIAGILPWYDRWRAMTVTDSAGLVALKNRILGDIVERSGKGYRKQLPSYEGYRARIEALVGRFLRGEAILEATETDPLSQATAEIGDVPPRLPQEDLRIHTHDSPDKEENSMMLYLTLAIALMGLIAAIAALRMMYRAQQPQIPVELQGLPQQLDELSFRLRRLERQVADSQSKEAVTHLIEIMESIEKRVVALESEAKG